MGGHPSGLPVFVVQLMCLLFQVETLVAREIPHDSFCVGACSSLVFGTAGTFGAFCALQVDSLVGRDVPMLKMLKRQIAQFSAGRRATITLVFFASHPVTVRWFTLPSRLYLPGSEISNMLPIEGKLTLSSRLYLPGSEISNMLPIEGKQKLATEGKN